MLATATGTFEMRAKSSMPLAYAMSVGPPRMYSVGVCRSASSSLPTSMPPMRVGPALNTPLFMITTVAMRGSLVFARAFGSMRPK
jgi:hypothetical protein